VESSWKKKRRSRWLWNQVFFFFFFFFRGTNNLTAKSWRQGFFFMFFFFYSCGNTENRGQENGAKLIFFFFLSLSLSFRLNRRLSFKIIKRVLWWTGTYDKKALQVCYIAICSVKF
jgi:hypothetical protein